MVWCQSYQSGQNEQFKTLGWIFSDLVLLLDCGVWLGFFFCCFGSGWVGGFLGFLVKILFISFFFPVKYSRVLKGK